MHRITLGFSGSRRFLQLNLYPPSNTKKPENKTTNPDERIEDRHRIEITTLPEHIRICIICLYIEQLKRAIPEGRRIMQRIEKYSFYLHYNPLIYIDFWYSCCELKSGKLIL